MTDEKLIVECKNNLKIINDFIHPVKTEKELLIDFIMIIIYILMGIFFMALMSYYAIKQIML